MTRLVAVLFLITLIWSGCINSMNMGCGCDNKPKIHVFQVSPDTVEQGKQVMLKWEVSGASSVSIEPGVGAVDMIGTKQVTVMSPTVYTITTANRFGKTEKTVSVAIGQSGGLAVENDPVKGGGSGGPSGEVKQPGDSQTSIGPSASALPGLSPSGSQSQMQSLTGSYLAPIPSDAVKASGSGNLRAAFWAVPNPVKPGVAAKLTWATTDASRIDLLDDYNETIKRDVDKNGSYDVKPSSTTTYKLRVTGASETLDLRYTLKVE